VWSMLAHIARTLRCVSCTLGGLRGGARQPSNGDRAPRIHAMSGSTTAHAPRRRQLIRRPLLLHPSVMEGGAQA